VGVVVVPGGRQAQVDAVKRILDFDGIEYDEAEISEALDSQQLNAMVQTVTLMWPQMPDELRAEIIAQWGEAAGYGEHDDLLTKAQAQLKKAADLAAKPQPAKPFGGGGGAPPGGADQKGTAAAGVAGLWRHWRERTQAAY